MNQLDEEKRKLEACVALRIIALQTARIMGIETYKLLAILTKQAVAEHQQEQEVLNKTPTKPDLKVVH